MKQHLYNFGIYKNIFKVKDRIFIFQDACDYFNDNNFINRIRNKVITDGGYDLDYSTDLILKDKSLINDLKDDDCYLLFTTLDQLYINQCNINEWDNSLKLDELCFLGWSINDVKNGMDSAITDGIFPFMRTSHLVGDQVEYQFNPYCLDDLNEWGLLPNMEICQKYLEINKKEITLFVLDEKVETNWQPLGIYCDKFTFEKLNKK